MLSIVEFLVKKHQEKKSFGYTPKDKFELIECIKKCLSKQQYDLNCIDTSNIDDMSSLFNLTVSHNSVILSVEQLKKIDISEWDTSKVRTMRAMFKGCEEFNSDISNWNVSRVDNMAHMFYKCEKFDLNLNEWDVSFVQFMSYMFYYCENFNLDLSNWNVKHTHAMDFMFFNCINFEGIGLDKWQVYASQENMFTRCHSLNKKPDWAW